MNLKTIITIINLAFESILFITVGVITVLTYLHAKDTILQPMRTELFKIQMEELSKVLKFFVGQEENDLREKFAFSKLINVNAIALIDEYASIFFDAKINVDDRPYNTKECPSFIVSEEYLEKNFELIESPVEIETKNESVIEKPDPRVRAALWQDYKYGMIYIPKQHSEMLNELREMLESPVLPSRCAKFIEEFIEAIQENTHKVASVLTECANELPQKLSTIKKLRKISLAWISNKYVDEFTELKPKADQIIESIRTHWAIDELTLKK